MQARRSYSHPTVELANFVSVGNDVIATEDLSNEVLAKSETEEVNGSDIDSDDDELDLRLPVVYAITAVDVLRVHFVRMPMGCQFLPQLDAMEAVIGKRNIMHHLQSHIGSFFHKK